MLTSHGFSLRSSHCNGRTPRDRLQSLDQVGNEPFFLFRFEMIDTSKLLLLQEST